MPKSRKAEDSFSESNLVKFLKMLSKEDMREFAKFVHSPFHNNRKDVAFFFDEIKKFHPAFNQKEFSKEKIFSALYPGKKYKDDVIRRLGSNLFKIGEEYAAYKNYRNKDFNFEKNLLDFYLIQNDDKFFWKQFEKIDTLMGKQSLRNSEHFHQLSLINKSEYTYSLKDDPNYKKTGFEKHLRNLWKYSLIEILKLSNCAFIETTYFNKHYKVNFIDELFKISEDSEFMDEPAIKIYYLILKLQTNEQNDETFFKVKNLIDINLHIFDKHEAFVLYAMIMTYCSVRKINPNKDYTKEEFDIARQMVENGLLTVNGSIDPNWFLGVFFRALNAKKIDFAGKFIESHKNMLIVKDKDNIINHTLASLAFSKKEYGKALEHLALASYKSVNDKLTVNVMHLQIYYEADMQEQFFYAVDSFKHLLKEVETIDKNQGGALRSFITLIVKIYRLKLGEIKAQPDEVKLEIKKSRVILRGWLIEKVNELIKKKINV